LVSWPVPTELRLDTGYVTAALTLPDELGGADLASIQGEVTRLLPGGWRTSVPPPAHPHVRIVVSTTDGTPRVALDGHADAQGGEGVLVELPTSAVASATLAYVTYTITERARQQRRMVSTHASALVTPEGMGVVLLGDKGTGKTSTAIALLRHGYRLLGDDLIVLAARPEGLEVLAGKQLAALRHPGAILGYTPKPCVDLADSATPRSAPVALAVRVGVHPATVAAVTAATPLSVLERLRLAENLARYITGTPTPLCLDPEVHAPVYPLDSPACAQTRARVIRQLAELGLRYLYAPTPQRAAGMIEELIPR
jgi:hypothetical protein